MGIQPFKRALLKTRVIALYKEGQTFREIGKQLGISHETGRLLWSEAVGDNPSLTQIAKNSKMSKEVQKHDD